MELLIVLMGGAWVLEELGENNNSLELRSRDKSPLDSCASESQVLNDAAAALSKESMCVAENHKVKVERSSETIAQSKDSTTADPASDATSGKAKAENHLPKLQISGLILKEEDNDPSVLLAGLTDGMITRPCKAVQQVLGMEVSAKELANNTNKTHKAGQAVGSLVPFVGLVALTRGASSSIIGDNLPPLCSLMVEQASAGFLMGSLFTPTHELKPGETLINARIQQGSKSAFTFATMTGTSGSLEQNMPQFGEDKLSIVARKVTIGVVSSTIGGFLDPRGQTSFGASSQDSLSSTLLFKTAEGKDAWTSLQRPTPNIETLWYTPVLNKESHSPAPKPHVVAPSEIEEDPDDL